MAEKPNTEIPSLTEKGITISRKEDIFQTLDPGLLW
jgi:hypothetical protein